MNILSEPTAKKEQLLEWVKTKKPNDLAIELLDEYWDISIKHGVNPVIVYCQSMIETGWLKFGGVLDASFKNTCGLKSAGGGDCDDPNAHTRFDSWGEGITAQVQHLCLYAGKDGYPLKNPVDPRHFSYIVGKCKTVESLDGNWAGKGYGAKILRLCEEVHKTKTNDIKENCKCEKEIVRLKAEISNLEDKIKQIKNIVI